MTDLKSGFLPINIEQTKAEDSSTSPVFLTVRVRRPQRCFHFPLRSDTFSLPREWSREGTDDGEVSENAEHESVLLLCSISNDAGEDGYRKGEGGGGRQKLEAGVANMRQVGLLGETGGELFIVNLHINDSFLPLMIPLLHGEIKRVGSSHGWPAMLHL